MLPPKPPEIQYRTSYAQRPPGSADTWLVPSNDAPTTFKILALAWLSAREEDHRVDELALNSIRLYRRLITKRLIPLLGDLDVAEIGIADLRHVLRALARTPAEANHALALARRLLLVAEDKGLRAPGTNFSRRIRRHPELASSNPASPEITRELFRRCAEIRAGRMDLCHPNQAALFQAVMTTGARPSEIRECRWSQVEISQLALWDTDGFATLHLERHKTARSSGMKTIVLGPMARGVFLSMRAGDDAGDDPVFPSHRNAGRPYNDINKAWRVVADYSGSTRGVCLRDFRSGMATNAYDLDVPLEQIQEMLGHEKIETTRGYTHISHRKIANAYQRNNASVFSSRRRRNGGRR